MESLDIVEFIMLFEKRFGVDLPDTLHFRNVTARDLWHVVVQNRTGTDPQAGEPLASDVAWREVVAFVADAMVIPPADVRPDTPLFGVE